MHDGIPLLTEASDVLSAEDMALLQLAVKVAKKAHKGQERKSGEPYIIHPLAVAQKVWSRFHDLPLTLAALLHDTLEDTPLLPEDIVRLFGPKVSFLVEAVSKNLLSYSGNAEVFSSPSEKFLWGGMQDVRVFLLKIADREHNLETIDVFREKKQVRMSFETQAMYLPLRALCRGESIAEIQASLQHFLVQHKLLEPKDLQHYLYQTTYQNFDQNLFSEIYKNSNHIVWKISDKAYYTELLQQKAFSLRHETLALWGDDRGNFLAEFRVKKGGFFFSGGSLSLSSSLFSSL